MTYWFYATSRRATFAFAVEGDQVVDCAPYGRKWLMGMRSPEAFAALKQRGYTISPMSA